MLKLNYNFLILTSARSKYTLSTSEGNFARQNACDARVHDMGASSLILGRYLHSRQSLVPSSSEALRWGESETMGGSRLAIPQSSTMIKEASVIAENTSFWVVMAMPYCYLAGYVLR